MTAANTTPMRRVGWVGVLTLALGVALVVVDISIVYLSFRLSRGISTSVSPSRSRWRRS
jgi:hypothetical protein